MPVNPQGAHTCSQTYPSGWTPQQQARKSAECAVEATSQGCFPFLSSSLSSCPLSRPDPGPALSIAHYAWGDLFPGLWNKGV